MVGDSGVWGDEVKGVKVMMLPLHPAMTFTFTWAHLLPEAATGLESE